MASLQREVREMSKPEKLLKLVYDLEADSALPGLSDQLKKNPKAYEVAFNHWLNHQIDTALKQSEAGNLKEA